MSVASRSMSAQNNSALASLTATYTDSENEDDDFARDDDSPQTDGSAESQVRVENVFAMQQTIRLSISNISNFHHQVIIPTLTRTPIKVQSAQSTPSKVEQSKSALRLVSYNDDTLVSDDDDEQSSGDENVSMEVAAEENKEEKKVEEPPPEEEKPKKDDRSVEYGFTLPEVKGKCPADLQDKITKMHKRMEENSLDMNKLIQERKEFRNPSIYEKLIQFCDIDELGTNYPPELYDPMQWGKCLPNLRIQFNCF